MNITLKLKSEIHDHQHAVREIGVARDGKLFFTRSDEMLLLYDLATGSKMKGFYDSAGYSAAMLGSDGRSLMYVSEDRIHSFDLTCWQERMLLFGELRELRDTDAHVGAGLWAVGSQDGSISVRKLGSDEDEPPEFVLQGHTGYVEYLTFHPSGKILASGSSDRTIRFWDVAGRQEISAHKVHDDFVTAIAFSPDGTIIVSGDYSGRVKVWEFHM